MPQPNPYATPGHAGTTPDRMPSSRPGVSGPRAALAFGATGAVSVSLASCLLTGLRLLAPKAAHDPSPADVAQAFLLFTLMSAGVYAASWALGGATAWVRMRRRGHGPVLPALVVTAIGVSIPGLMCSLGVGGLSAIMAYQTHDATTSDAGRGILATVFTGLVSVLCPAMSFWWVAILVGIGLARIEDEDLTTAARPQR